MDLCVLVKSSITFVNIVSWINPGVSVAPKKFKWTRLEKYYIEPNSIL